MVYEEINLLTDLSVKRMQRKCLIQGALLSFVPSFVVFKYFGESLTEHRSTQNYNLTMLIVFYNLNFELNERSHGL